MGKTKAPIIRYPLSGSGPVIGFILWMTEQALITWFGDWWPQIPWGWLTLIALGFCLGQLFADWFNKNSWLRQKYEHSRRFFDVDGCRVVPDVDGGKTHLKVICRIRFVCRVEHADLVISSGLLRKM
jgi:hypothetical protein